MNELTTAKRYFTLTDDTSNKFWQIEGNEASLTVVYGRIGAAGQSNTKTFDTEERCQAEIAKLIREKTGKGYLEVVDGQTVAAPEAGSKKPRAKGASPDKEAENALLEAYNGLIERTALKELLPFLHQVDRGHYVALRKRIKAAHKHYDEYLKLPPMQGSNNKRYEQWGYRGTWEQRQLIILSALAVFTKEDIRSLDFMSVIRQGPQSKLAQDILAWARPAWFTDYLNNNSRANIWQSPDYVMLREWEQQGIVSYEPELFVRSLSHYNQHWDDKATPYKFIDFLCQDDVLCQRELPLLFEYETDLHATTGWTEIPNEKRRETIFIWPIVFQRLLADGKLDRAWFMEACITVQSKDWNSNLRSFFRKQVEELKPTAEELGAVQSQVFQLLGAQHQHVVNWAAGMIKEMAAGKDFRLEELADWAQAIMMRSDCKAGIKILLSVFEKQLKADLQTEKILSPLIADVFALNDLALQTKAAALLQKYASPNNEDLCAKVQLYEAQILGTLRTGLMPFLAGDVDVPAAFNQIVGDGETIYQFASPTVSSLAACAPISLPLTWNDLLFAIGKFIASDDPLDGEILLNAMILTPPDAQIAGNEQLQPYIKQLTKSSSDSWIRNYTRAWLLQLLHNDDTPFKFEQQWQTNVQTLQLQKERLKHAQSKRINASRLPLLSLPTHEPHWIAGKTLVERLIAYQQAGEPIEMLDLAIALARMHPENDEQSVELCKKLEAPLQRLMHFALTGEGVPGSKQQGGFLKSIINGLGRSKEPQDLEMMWAVAARTRNPEAVFKEFEGYAFAARPNIVAPFVPAYSMEEKWNEYKNYKTKEMERTPSWYELRLAMPAMLPPEPNLLYSNDLFLPGKDYWYYRGMNGYDTQWWYSLVPQAPESLFTTIVNHGCGLNSVGASAVQGLHIMLQPHFRFGPMSLLALSCCLMAEKRETRGLAAEVLISHFGEQTIDVEEIAEKIGWLLAQNYAPVLRFTESIQLVKDVSATHNKAIAIVLGRIFEALASLKELPKNTKKLLELYLDLLVRLGERPAENVLHFLLQHKASGTLKSVINTLQNL